jgi:hypothetical protein
MAPPSTQSRKIPDNPFRCDRLIQYRGKVLPCDSALRRDGESLHSIYEHSPEAGILIAATAGIIANIVNDQNHQLGRQDTAKVLRAAGLGLTVGSVVFGFSALRANEDHLQSSIIKYNASAPDHPIEVLFKKEF